MEFTNETTRLAELADILEQRLEPNNIFSVLQADIKVYTKEITLWFAIL